MEESVQLAAVLLTDLVSSTRLGREAGPARADEMREEHFELLRRAIGEAGGREVKNTGDGLMVAFASPSAAVECAVAMQQLCERRNSRAEQDLHVRIGIGAGEATVKDGDYFGVPSIEAARLCAQAPADGIYVSQTVKLLAGRCEGVAFEHAGELELKGFSEPVGTFEVRWVPLDPEAGVAGGWPLPAVLRSVPAVSYVGRERERAELAEAWELAREGERQLVLLCGEPGIGKTRLAGYAAHAAHAHGAAVSWGGSSEELAAPYEPWIEVCSGLVEHCPRELLAQHVERHGGELGRLTSALGRRVPGLPEPRASDPETERYLLFSAVAGLLSQMSEALGVLVVLDDMQWADGQSIALLGHVVRNIEHGALEVIATYRDSDLGKDHPLAASLAGLRRLEGVRRLALQGLDAGQVGQMMVAIAGEDLTPEGHELAERIAAETAGNPFFAGEIVRGLVESGTLGFDEGTGRWNVDSSARLDLPESVREVIENRVARLGRAAADALETAAVIGRSFDVALLAAVLDGEEASVLDHLEAGVAAALLSESGEHVGRFTFTHGLINQTLYEGLGATRRARTHEQIARALEELPGAGPEEHVAELASHWRLAAVSVDTAKAARYARLAGERALDSLAPGEALRLFGDAVELSDGAGTRERCEALIGLGAAQRQTGDAAYRATLLEAAGIASELGDAELAARASLENNRGYSSVIGAVDEERLAAIRRAIELDEPSVPGRRARLLSLQAQELAWGPDFDERCALAIRAVALARRSGDERTLVEVLSQVSFALWSAETLELRTDLAAELDEAAQRVPDPTLRFGSHYIALSTSLERGELAAAEEALERMRQTAEDLGRPTQKWFAAFPRAGYELMRGDLAAAEQISEQAFATGQEAEESDAILVYGAQLGYTRTCQGRGEEIVALLEGSVDAYPAIAAWRAALVWCLCWLGRREEAGEKLALAAADGFQHVHPGAAKLTALALYADVAAQLRATGPAKLLRDALDPFSEQIVWNSVTGCGHTRMWLGLLADATGDYERADEDLALACSYQEANGLLLWAARARLGWAESLARRGEERWRDQASRALALSREHGYGLFEQRAAALLDMAAPDRAG